MDYHFSGYATKNDLLCGDGVVIRHDAFKECDGVKVPLVWNHDHSDPDAVLGHAILENRDDGVYAYCTCNDTERGRNARTAIEHGDITAMSIFANKIKRDGRNIVHGVIRELSLVLAGCNPGATIDFVMAHGEDEGEGFYANYDEAHFVIKHSMEETKKEDKSVEEPKVEEPKSEKTFGEVLDTLNEEQKNVVDALIYEALNANNEGGNDTMKHNVFEEEDKKDVLVHADMKEILADAKRCGSLKEAVEQHEIDADSLCHSATYGIDHIDYLFPEATNLNKTPGFIKRKDDWVSVVMNGVHHSPFSRIKSMFANITADEARAKGYTKGNKKMEEVFTLLKRTTTPTTIYKKQKLDRDDMIDITDFDVVAWLKSEMRMMLNEEIARAILVGDGRSTSSDDKINETNIRPIWTDDSLYSVKKEVAFDASATNNENMKEFVRTVIRGRKDYRGSGTPIMFCSEDILTELLLIEDQNGRLIYDDQSKLCNALRVSRIVPVAVMDNLTRTVGSNTHKLLAIVVNLNDYNVGADKGGAVSMFDDFDIDYNQQKYLMETRCSGALTVPYSALVFEATPPASQE